MGPCCGPCWIVVGFVLWILILYMVYPGSIEIPDLESISISRPLAWTVD